MKFNYPKTIWIGFGFLGIVAFWQMYDSTIPIILKEQFQLSDTWAGFIMSLDNILAIFMLPLFGSLSDKRGKRMPFVVLGTVLSVTLFLLLPLPILSKSLPIFIALLLLVLLAMGTYRSPTVALMPDLTEKVHRSKANAIINLMGSVGAVFSLLLIAVLMPEDGNFYPLYIGVAIIMVTSMLLLRFKIKEVGIAEKQIQQKREAHVLPKEVKRSLLWLLLAVALWFMGYNAISSAFTKYARVYLGVQGGDFAYPLLVATLFSILSFVPIGFLSAKVGRKKMIYLGLFILLACFGIAYTFTSYDPIINVLFALFGFGWAAINVNSYPMVVEMSKSSDVGKFTGYYYSFSMAAQIVTPILS
ncbi:MAG: MFS transporter, partial [Erysipelotrichaceae bacterium]